MHADVYILERQEREIETKRERLHCIPFAAATDVKMLTGQREILTNYEICITQDNC